MFLFSLSFLSLSQGKVSHDSIKQLVLEAEHLVRDAQEAALKTPTKQKHSIITISSTVKKRELTMPGPIKQRVEVGDYSYLSIDTFTNHHSLFTGMAGASAHDSTVADHTSQLSRTAGGALGQAG